MFHLFYQVMAVHFCKYLDGPFFLFASILKLTSKSKWYFCQKKKITGGPNYRWGQWTIKLYTEMVNGQQVMAGDPFQ